LKVLNDVKAELRFWRFNERGEWIDTTRTDSQALGVGEDVEVSAVWPEDSNNLWLYRSGYLVPQTLELACAEDGCSEVSQLKSMPHMFEAKGLMVKQHFATSADGTKVCFEHTHTLFFSFFFLIVCVLLFPRVILILVEHL
jgi:prolyl oligopeptidase